MSQFLVPKSRRLADDTLAATTIQWAVFIAMIAAGVCFASNAVKSFGAASPAAVTGTADPELAETDTAAVASSPGLDMWPVVSILWFAVTGVYGFTVFRARPSDAEPNKTSSVPRKTQFVAKRQAILKILAADKGNMSHSRLQIRHVMTSNPSVVSPETSKSKLRSLMDRDEHRHLPVCDKDRQLIGVVSDRDVKKKKGGCAGDIMTRDPFSVSPDSFVSPAVTQMLNRHISCLPVVEDNRVCGVVTTSDMMMTLQCMLQLFDQTVAPDDDGDADSRVESTGHAQPAGVGDACVPASGDEF